MPQTQTPNFDQIARVLVTACDGPTAEMRIAEELRLMWNARGAADVAKVEATLTSLMGATACGPYLKNLDRALRGLDR